MRYATPMEATVVIVCSILISIFIIWLMLRISDWYYYKYGEGKKYVKIFQEHIKEIINKNLKGR